MPNSNSIFNPDVAKRAKRMMPICDNSASNPLDQAVLAGAGFRYPCDGGASLMFNNRAFIDCGDSTVPERPPTSIQFNVDSRRIIAENYRPPSFKVRKYKTYVPPAEPSDPTRLDSVCQWMQPPQEIASPAQVNRLISTF
jgi:hypothetical protein